MGIVADGFANPVWYLEINTALKVIAVDAENELSLDKDSYEGVVRDSLDPYLFIRSAYAQDRQGKIAK